MVYRKLKGTSNLGPREARRRETVTGNRIADEFASQLKAALSKFGSVGSLFASEHGGRARKRLGRRADRRVGLLLLSRMALEDDLVDRLRRSGLI